MSTYLVPNGSELPSALAHAVATALATLVIAMGRCATPNGGDGGDERPSARLQAIAITLGTFAAILTWQLISQAH